MRNKNIYFIGEHNKPELQPLDSSTWSGKVIDAIIKSLPENDLNYIKTNLCDLDYKPKSKIVIHEQYKNWIEKYKPKDGDIVILLGNWVNTHFIFPLPNFEGLLFVFKAYHPASFKARANIETYKREIIGGVFSGIYWK